LLGKPAQSVYESDRAIISDRLRKVLEEELAPDIRRLRDRLGEDFDGWGIA
jgi:hypothetical protein